MESFNNQQKISEEPQSPNNNTNDIANNISTADSITTIEDSKGKKNFGKKIAFAIILLLIAGLTAFGFYKKIQYDKYAGFVPTLSLLPENPNLVITAASDPSGENFKQLETHLQKFPGYQILIKKMDETGKGRPISEQLQDNLDKYSLDFQSDVKGALGDNFYIVINDLSPLGQEVQKTILTFDNLSKVNPRERLAFTNKISEPTVLGESDLGRKGKEDFVFPKLDFTAAAEIKDLAKVKSVLEKLKTEKNYKYLAENYKDYQYYAVENPESKEESFAKLYTGIIAKNLIVSSSESEIKNAIDKASSLTIFSSNKNKIKSLAENNIYKEVSSNLRTENQLLSLYLNLNFKEFFGKKNCETEVGCEDLAKYFKQPNDLVQGISLKTNSDGILFDIVSNKTSLKDTHNIAFETGMSDRIPDKIAGNWNDFFIEHSNLKEIYYDFKENNLTEEGLKKWNDLLAEASKFSGIDIEKDIIDQINGKSAFSIFTNPNNKPEGVIVIEIKDRQRIEGTIKTLVENLRQAYISSLSDFEQFNDNNSKYSIKFSAAYKKKIEDAKNAKLIETQTQNGKVYSFEIPDAAVSFHFSAEKNELIMGSNSEIVSQLLDTSNQNKLSKNNLFIRAQKYEQKEGYTRAFLATQGIVNIASYYLSQLEKTYAEQMKNYADANKINEVKTEDPLKEMKDALTAFGAVLRTLKFSTSSNAIQGEYIVSSLFLDIKELPAEEKAAAEDILEKIIQKEGL